ncbi:hypothetical protein BGW80DRAFT_1454239 [Lactifluus volemus]|nr:hypothetical protein BGW80DRAFT_1454239 [Lactifluus volemus]
MLIIALQSRIKSPFILPQTFPDTRFVDRIRERDKRCCITGQLVFNEDYTGFETAHIFPLSETDIWNNLNYQHFIEDDQIVSGCELNSIQQGFLCSSTDIDNYRIYDFVDRDPSRTPHGKIFIATLMSSSGIFRAGESDDKVRHFDPDIDLRMGGFNLTNGTWWSTSEGKKQLEAELATRLWGVNISSGV